MGIIRQFDGGGMIVPGIKSRNCLLEYLATKLSQIKPRRLIFVRFIGPMNVNNYTAITIHGLCKTSINMEKS